MGSILANSGRLQQRIEFYPTATPDKNTMLIALRVDRAATPLRNLLARHGRRARHLTHEITMHTLRVSGFERNGWNLSCEESRKFASVERG